MKTLVTQLLEAAADYDSKHQVSGVEANIEEDVNLQKIQNQDDYIRLYEINTFLNKFSSILNEFNDTVLFVLKDDIDLYGIIFSSNRDPYDVFVYVYPNKDKLNFNNTQYFTSNKIDFKKKLLGAIYELKKGI